MVPVDKSSTNNPSRPKTFIYLLVLIVYVVQGIAMRSDLGLILFLLVPIHRSTEVSNYSKRNETSISFSLSTRTNAVCTRCVRYLSTLRTVVVIGWVADGRLILLDTRSIKIIFKKYSESTRYRNGCLVYTRNVTRD